jgi:hypothetical protein
VFSPLSADTNNKRAAENKGRRRRAGTDHRLTHQAKPPNRAPTAA